jgi:hypothetical protein
MREATGERRWPIFQRRDDQAHRAAQAQLAPDAWAAAWTAGRALPAAQAVAEAPADGDPSPSLDALPLLIGGSPRSPASGKVGAVLRRAARRPRHLQCGVMP